MSFIGKVGKKVVTRVKSLLVEMLGSMGLLSGALVVFNVVGEDCMDLRVREIRDPSGVPP